MSTMLLYFTIEYVFTLFFFLWHLQIYVYYEFIIYNINTHIIIYIDNIIYNYYLAAFA